MVKQQVIAGIEAIHRGDWISHEEAKKMISMKVELV